MWMVDLLLLLYFFHMLYQETIHDVIADGHNYYAWCIGYSKHVYRCEVEITLLHSQFRILVHQYYNKGKRIFKKNTLILSTGMSEAGLSSIF